MKTVVFLTSTFPYPPGEQFIEGEMEYWANQKLAQVVLVPLTAYGSPRKTPAGIHIDLTLAQTGSIIGKLKYVIPAVTSRFFWREVQFVYTSQGLKWKCYAQALRSVSSVLRIEKALKKMQVKYKKIDIAYCYWNEAQAYAAVLLRRVGLVSKVVSRAHGYDVYEVSRNDGYMPLKRQFVKEIDLILAISNQGKAYLERTYDASGARIQVSRLGVPIPSMTSVVTVSDRLNIVSVAFCVPVKRIDKIIDGIADAVLRLKNKKITWTHIGDGILFDELLIYASEKLMPLGVDLKFLGNKSNAEVREFFEKNSVDIFINTSESEGVPVSIMEAMSYGVPVIAPNVGGISELVSNEYGCLLSGLASVPEIASAIVEMSFKCKSNHFRSLARQKIIVDYNSDKNYKELVCLVAN